MQYTSHIRKNGSLVERQTVEEHCLNTAALAANYGESFSCPQLARLIGTFHDTGKLCEDFDNYINERNNLSRGSIDHCYAGARYLGHKAEASGQRNMVEMAELVGRVILSHHGLHDWIDADGTYYYGNRIGKLERYDEIEKNTRLLFPDAQTDLLMEQAVNEYKLIQKKIRNLSGDQDATTISFYFFLFERLMESTLVDADRTDTADFCLGRKEKRPVLTNFWKDACEKMEAKVHDFRQKQDRVSLLRSDISDRCRKYASREHGICRLIVPTGGGKTLASLRFALHYCKLHKKDHIFYIAPFMSILEQNSDIWKEIVGEDNFIEHHSNAMADLASAEEVQKYELVTENWDIPVVATTLVQFLNTFYSDQMDCVRRMHQLSNSVVILDEVQSIPTKCISLFNLAMNFLSRICNTCIVLCSATQPVFEKTKYRLLIDETDPNMSGAYENDFLALKRNAVVPELRIPGYSFDEAAIYCKEKYDKKGSVLFVVNTKRAAFEIYERVKTLCDPAVKVVYLSTNLCPERRRHKIAQIKQSLIMEKKDLSNEHTDRNKSGFPKGGIICITTQLIEAGVDVSFPCVIRSVAGLDHIAQAAGRCNRNDEYPGDSEVYIINLQEENISGLKEILTGQQITNTIIRNVQQEQLLSVETMSRYYELYFRMWKDKLSYEINDYGCQTELLKLLSLNNDRWNMKRAESPWWHRQAAKTAGMFFQVIDTATVPVLVPDNEESKNLISVLKGEMFSWELQQALRKAQKYLVEIYPQTEKKLIELQAIEKLPCGLYVLQEEYYDPDIGIVTEGKQMELLMY